MYIRIEFEDMLSKETKETIQTLTGSPSGTCLSSSNSQLITTLKMREETNNSVWFWFLDVDILNKYYGGAIESLNSLKKYKGVKNIYILPIENKLEFDDILEVLSTKYLNYSPGI